MSRGYVCRPRHHQKISLVRQVLFSAFQTHIPKSRLQILEGIMVRSAGRVRQITDAVKSFLFGAMVHELVRDAFEKRARAEYALMLVTVGDMLGYPISSYYRLRLLPYWIRRIAPWKRYFLKDRDIIENVSRKSLHAHHDGRHAWRSSASSILFSEAAPVRCSSREDLEEDAASRS